MRRPRFRIGGPKPRRSLSSYICSFAVHPVISSAVFDDRSRYPGYDTQMFHSQCGNIDKRIHAAACAHMQVHAASIQCNLVHATTVKAFCTIGRRTVDLHW